MTKQRKEKLLMDVAKQFEEAMTPMHHEWLVENNVKLDECGDICDSIALIIRGYLQAPERIQMALLACSAVDGKEMADYLVNVMDRNRVMKTLGCNSK